MGFLFPVRPVDEKDAARLLLDQIQRSIDESSPPGHPILFERLCTELDASDADFAAVAMTHIVRNPALMRNPSNTRRLISFAGHCTMLLGLHGRMLAESALIALRADSVPYTQSRFFYFSLICEIQHPLTRYELHQLKDIRERIPLLWLKAFSIAKLHDELPSVAYELLNERYIEASDIATSVRSWVRDIADSAARLALIESILALPIGDSTHGEIKSWAVKQFGHKAMPKHSEVHDFIKSAQTSMLIPAYKRPN